MNTSGQSFEKSAFYALNIQNGSILGAQRVHFPRNFTVVNLPEELFECFEETPKDKLVLSGVVASVENRKKIQTTLGRETCMRELVLHMSTDRGHYKNMCVTVWGEIANQRVSVDDVLCICNAKQAKFQGIPRFSVGDTGSITVCQPNIPFWDGLRTFVDEAANGNMAFELPAGVVPWVEAEEDNTHGDAAEEQDDD